MKNDRIELVDEYLDSKTWRVSENSNASFCMQGLNNFISSEIVKSYWLEKVYDDEIGKAHVSGDIHIHDLNLLSAYCVGWDLADLLTFGFGGVPCKTESRPPKHFRSALGQIVNFLYTLQNETSGAQAFSSIDTYLAPFIREDKLTYKEVRQAMQEFIFNLNVPTRTAAQTPFTNITLDLHVPSSMKDEPVIIGGVRQETTYGEYQAEMNMFNKAFFEVMTDGDAKGRIFTFPVPTINVTKDFDWDDPKLSKLWEVTAKYGIAYFCNFVNSDLNPEDARSMCCRLRLDLTELKKKGGGLFGSAGKTGSIGVTTLNLPRLAYKSKTKEEFFEGLEKLMDICSRSLEKKREMVEKYTEDGLYPYARFYLKSVKEHRGYYWANHFSTIGFVGMNEACLNLLGVGIDDPEGRSFGLEIMDRMREKLKSIQIATGHMYNLEATPAEGASHRLAKTDKKQFPDIICANEKDVKEKGSPAYYTNSCQLPVDKKMEIFEVLDHQDAFQEKFTGGTVLHTFVGEKISNPNLAKEFVKTVFSNYRLPYLSVTPTFSVCSEHGYIAGEVEKCPECGKDCEIYSRVVGYLRPVSSWNAGKKEEFRNRETFHLTRKTLNNEVKQTIVQKDQKSN